MAEREDDYLPLSIPLKDGTSIELEVQWEMFWPDKGRIMTFYEMALDPDTSADVARMVAQAIKTETKYSPADIAAGFLYQTAQGATLGWAEELSTSLTALPTLAMESALGRSDPDTSPYDQYKAEREQQRTQLRTQGDLFSYVNPKTTAIARGVGLSIPIAAALIEPTPVGEAAIAESGFVSWLKAKGRGTAAAAKASNPFAITATGLPATLAETITKSVMIAMINEAGNAEGYLAERVERMPEAVRHGLEWGIIANMLLFGTLGAFNVAARVPAIRDKFEFLTESPDLVRRLAAGETGEVVDRFREMAIASIVRANEKDLFRLNKGIVPAWLRTGDFERFQVAKRGTGDVTGQYPYTVGELGGPNVQARQRQSLREEPVTGLEVVQTLEDRAALEGARVSAALRETQTGLPRSVHEELATAEATTLGTVGGEAIEGLEGGVAGVYYAKGYAAPEIPLAGARDGPGFMKIFQWRRWPDIYKHAQELREMRILNNRSEAYTVDGLSNKLPAWDDFTAGIRYIPKSTFKQHGTLVKEQLNPDTGLWQPYRHTPFKRGGVSWKTREVLKANDFNRIREHFNPKTDEWVEVQSGRQPHPGWATRFVESGDNFVVRLKNKSMSMETLHDMRQALDQLIAKNKALDGMGTWVREANVFRGRLDAAVKANPDMAKADSFFSAFRDLETAAALGTKGVKDNFFSVKRQYDKLSPADQTIFKAAFIEEIEALNMPVAELTTGRFPERLRMLYADTTTGSAAYEKAMDQLKASAAMKKRGGELAKVREDILAQESEVTSGWMQTLRLLAKIPAYKFSSEFALGRDLIERARDVDRASKAGVNAQVNDILGTLSGPQAAKVLDELASYTVRVKGDTAAANIMRNAARRSALGVGGVGQVQTTGGAEIPTTDLRVLRDPEGEGLVPLNALLPEPEEFYPATEAAKVAGQGLSWTGRQIKKPWDLMMSGRVQ